MNITQIIADSQVISSEIILIISSIISLIYGLFARSCYLGRSNNLILLVGMIYSFLMLPLNSQATAFGGAIVSNEITALFRMIILITSFICLICIIRQPFIAFEIPILMMVATAALMLMVASNDLMTLYLTMELAALTMYICVSSTPIASEGGIKYFILGSLASCLFLLGSSTISGFTGSFMFDAIGGYMIEGYDATFLPMLFILSGFMIFAAFFFKMSAAPFHLWIADVYNVAPWNVTLFIGSVSKIAIVGLFIRVLYTLFDNLNLQIQDIIILISVLSMFIGSIAAIMQTDLRRILAYSSVGNMGFALAGISTLTLGGISSGFIYITIYSIIMFIPAFMLVEMLTPKGKNVLLLSDLKSLSVSNPYRVAILAFLMLSIAGLPPFAGFFGKLYILMNLIANTKQDLTILFIIAAILSSIYCINIIRSIYFSNKKPKFSSAVGACVILRPELLVIITILCIVNLIYCTISSQVMEFTLEIFKNLL